MTDVLDLREQLDVAERSILMSLPAIDLIQDQVSKTMEVARDKSQPTVYLSRLRVANKMLPYAKAMGNGDFWKYHVIMSILLSGIPNASEDADVKKLDNLNKDLETTIAQIQDVIPISTDEWMFRDMLPKLLKLNRGEGQDAFIISLMIICDVLKNEPYNKGLSAGVMYLLLSFRLNNEVIPPVSMLLYNEFQVVATEQKF